MADGVHVIGDLHLCTSAQLKELTTDVMQTLKDAIISVGLTPVKECFHQFTDDEGNPDGYTGGYILAESHLMVHTWPKVGKVNLCVYVCNFSRNNSDRARKLVDLLLSYYGSQEPKIQIIWRS